MFSLNAIAPILVMLALGYFLKRIGLLTQDFLKKANRVCYLVFLPVLLFENIYNVDSIKNINVPFLLYGCGAIFVTFIACSFFVRYAIKDPFERGALLQCSFRSNYAIIGIPLATALFGAEAAGAASLMSAFSIPFFNVLAILALTLFKGDGRKIQPKKIIMEIVKNPLIIGVISGVLVLLIREAFVAWGVSFRIKDINFLYVSIDYVARVGTPLALIILGGQFEFSAVKKLAKYIAVGVLLRNVIVPGVLLTIAYFFVPGLSGEHYAAYIALFASPVAVTSAILAAETDNDEALAGQLVVWTTILSSITLFVIIYIFRSIGVFG